jgi:hypothetical protein
MRENQYVFEHGSYYLVEVNYETGERLETLYMCDTVSVAYDAESYSMRKHGSPERVHAWAKEERQKMLKAGLADWAKNLCVVDFPRAYPVENINKVLSTTGFLRFLLGKDEQPVPREDEDGSEEDDDDAG